MCDTAVALETIAASVHADTNIGVDTAHRRLMAAQAVVIDRLPALRRDFYIRRIVAKHFMIRIDHARTALLEHVVHRIVVRQVAVRAFQLAMRRHRKGRRLSFHRMARPAESRRSRKGHGR